jgi:tagatose 6-phosphate kinase
VILCVAPSPAWDVTYHVDRLREHATNRARTVSGRAGGKAVNVGRVLHALGEPVTVLAPVGGPTGELFAEDLAAHGVATELVDDALETRRTVTIVSDETGDATVVNEPGRLGDWAVFLDRAEQLMSSASVVVGSGSLPSGAPVDAYARLARAAASHGLPMVVDTSGPALVSALAASPALVKPNLSELREIGHDDDPVEAARRLAGTSGTAVVVSLGAAGMVLATADHAWRASLPAGLRGNPTGAGDAAVAAFARGLRMGADWPAVLVDAVAVSGAAVLAPYAGEFAPADHERLAASVVVERIDHP